MVHALWQYFIADYCVAPQPPLYGKIDDYNNTMKGTNITFQCDEGHLPSEKMLATCVLDTLSDIEMWSPNPANITCKGMILIEYYFTWNLFRCKTFITISESKSIHVFYADNCSQDQASGMLYKSSQDNGQPWGI